MIKTFKTNLFRHLANLPGWRTHRKLVVIESDDWGSLRMPSLDAFHRLEKAGLDLRSWDAERYNLNDSLESSKDLELLFEVLSGVKDKNGNYAVFTPITIVANPDFEKIKQSDFKEYFCEPFTETLKKYPGCENAFALWQEGIQRKIFIPQMHGREHLNVTAWMSALQKGEKQTLLAFHEGLWGFVPDQQALPGIDYQAAFLLNDPSELEYHKTVIKEGLDIFEQLFGCRAVYFVPPNGPFNNRLNAALAENGVRYRSVAKMQRESAGNGKFKRSFHWLGQKEKHGITYISRNCFFEPNQPGKDWVNSCLGEMEIAFRMKKPAVISSHRVNYVGTLNPKNREEGLRQLRVLLSRIMKKWPDAEFMTTAQLGVLMRKK